LISIGSIMSRDVRWVAPAAPTSQALELMRDQRISCVVVCEDGRPVGILTERDAARIAADLLLGRPASAVSEVMTAPAHTVHTRQTLDDAIRVAEDKELRHLPVVDDAGRLAGIVTQTDLLRAHMQAVERLVEDRTLELAAANRRLEALSLQDGLLGIRNRRSLEQDLARLHATYQRYHRPYAVILSDLDWFKAYNDRYGHLAGDDVLRKVAHTIRGTLRGADSAYRYGGEEILVTLPETGPIAVRHAAERIRQAVEALAIPHEGSSFGLITLSCGVAAALMAEPLLATWHEVVGTADEALYRAKSAGRNRVEV
jgi:diguanylate cyclase (GGDEF)-like protein